MHLTAIHPRSRRSGDIDMLNGAVLPKLLRFSIPLMLSSALQLTFNAADVIVVGRFEGDLALAAVGVPGSLINLLVNLFMGLSVGTNVMVAQDLGAGDHRGVSATVHTSILLSILGGLLVGAFGAVCAGTFLRWMSTPEDIWPMATQYMRIYFLGMPANMIYNFGAAVLRATGDTKRPLYYLTAAGVVNVMLNLVFVIVFRMGVAGVAWATIIAQYISMLLVLLCLTRAQGAIRLNLRALGIDPVKLRGVLRVGLPAGLQGTFFSISNVLIQSTVNTFGAIAVAGNTCDSNLENYVYVCMNSIYQGAITFTGQNVGARKYDRIGKVTRDSLIAVSGIGILLCAILGVFARPLLHIYTNDEAVVTAALNRTRVFVPTYFTCGCMDAMCGVLRGMGSSLAPMIISVMGACGLRILWILFIFPFSPTLFMLYVSYPVSWVITLGVYLVFYFFKKKKLLQNI